VYITAQPEDVADRLLNANPTLNYANDSVWFAGSDAPDRDMGGLHVLDFDRDVGPAQQGRLPGEARRVQHLQPLRVSAGPICSPSAPSLLARYRRYADDIYFLAKNDGSGTHAFAKTQANKTQREEYGYTP